VTAARPLVSTVGEPGSGGAQNSHRQPFPDAHPREMQTRDDRQFGTELPTGGEPQSRLEPPPRALTTARRSGPTPSIADFYADLLQPLNERQRKGLIAQLSVGYFEGWRPTRPEMAQLVAQELRRGHPRR